MHRQRKGFSKLHHYRLMEEYRYDWIFPCPVSVINYPFVIIKHLSDWYKVSHNKCSKNGNDNNNGENEPSNKESKCLCKDCGK